LTVSTTTSRADYTGNGATVAFAVPFYFLDNAHLTVLRTQVSTGAITTLALTTDYTVTGAGNPAGGTVTCVVAPTNGQTLSILRNVPLTQLNTYVPNDPFPAASHERALDQLTMEVQQLDEELGRSLTIPPNVATGSISTQLPAPAGGKIIGWNGSGNALANYDTSFLATVVGFGSQVSDLFSGTGSQTSFTLSQNPGSVYNLRVSISGVLQRPTVDYNWFSGTTLIFTSAPASGTNNIMVQYGSTVPQGALEWYDSDNSHVLRLSNTANYTADRTLSVNTGDADRSLTLTGNATLTGTNTGDQTITLTGDVTGTGTGSFATTISANTITSAMIVDGTIVNGDIASNAVIAHSKLANITAGQVLLGNGSNVPTATALSGDVTVDSTGVTQIGSGKVVEAMLANDAVSNAKLDNMPANRFKGRITGGSGNPEDLTGTEATSLLNTFTSSLKGLAPSSGGGTTNFLRADGTWAAPSGVSDGDKGDITVSSSGSVFTIDNDVVTYAKIQNVSATDRILGRSSSGAGDIEEITCTAAGRALIDDADATAQRTTLGLAIGTNVQAYDADLAALAGISTNGVLARTGAGTAAARTITGTAPIAVTNGDGVSGNPTISVSDITDTQIKSDAAIDATKLSFLQAGTGANARSVQAKLREVVSVTDFGASTTETAANNKTAFDEAVAAVSAAGGGTVMIPTGTFDITTLANIPANVVLRGESRSKSVIRTTSATGDVIKLDGARAGVMNLTVSSSVTRTANAFIGHTANASQIFVDSVDLLAPFIGIEISSDIAVFIITDVAIRDTVHTTGSSIIVRGGFVVHLDRVMCSQSSSAIRPANHLLVESVHDIQVENTQFIGAVNDVNIAPGNGQTVFSVQLTSVLLDDAQGPAIRVAPTGTGIVRMLFVQSPWIFGTSQDVLVTNVGGGTVQTVHIENSLFVGTGVGVDITGAAQAIVQNCRIGGKTTAVSYTSVGRGLITDNLLGPNGPYGANTTAISLAGTTANVIVQGNNVNGSTAALSNTASGVNHVEFYDSSATNLRYPVAPAIFSTAGTEAFRISGGDATFADDVTVKGDVVVEKATGISAAVKAKSGASNFEFVYNDGAGAYISNTGSVPMYFYIGGTERFRIESGGDVGIGVSASPTAKLEVAGNVNLQEVDGRYLGFGTSTFSFDSQNIPNYGIAHTRPGGASFNTVLTGFTNIKLLTNQSERVRIDNSGNVGIGATSFGTSAAGVLGIKNGTAPTTGVADTVQFYSSDHAAGHTIPSFYCEGTEVVMTDQADSTSDIRIRVRINGTVYQLLAKAN
jgi:hypothetical protein